jgi:hypothetical protein
MFRLLFAFLAGAISMLLLLTPGKLQWQTLFDKDSWAKTPDFEKAAERVENAPDMAVFYACKAKEYVKDKID